MAIPCALMSITVPTRHIDRRYEARRIRHPKREKALLASIRERGIEDPVDLTGEVDSGAVLLDGFKRLRCAIRLGIDEVPARILDANEAMGVIKFLRLSAGRGLHSLEEAQLVQALHEVHGLDIPEIAMRLSRSGSWVRMRLGLLKSMPRGVREKIFSGAFPFRSWMYTLRRVTRVHSWQEVEAFAGAVSGRGLSTRDIELLAGSWFGGSAAAREQITGGNLEWTLRELKQRKSGRKSSETFVHTPEGGKLVRDLNIIRACMHRARNALLGLELGHRNTFRDCRRPAEGVLNLLPSFTGALEEFYEKGREASDRMDVVPGGPG